uniref:Fibronectin type-III domain-containing protein n=1 Tax=Ornithorhynchus anatinus TaxID=9258 RepID=A0A6I8NE69_ORNAN
MCKSISVDDHLGSLGCPDYMAHAKDQRGKTKLCRQFSLGSAERKDFYQSRVADGGLSRFAYRLLVKQKQEKRKRAEGVGPPPSHGPPSPSSAFRPRSLSIEWSSPPRMTQQMRDLPLAPARKPLGPSSPNAAKRLYRNLSGKFRVSYVSLDEGSAAGRSDRDRDRLHKPPTVAGSGRLLEAVEQQDLEGVRELLASHSADDLDLNTPNSEGLQPLDIALMTNNAPIARALLQAGATESPHFVSLESRALHLATLVREAGQRVQDLAAQGTGAAAGPDGAEREKQLSGWTWRQRLYQRMQAGFEHARVPDAPSCVRLSVVSSSTLKVTFQEPLSINSAVVTKYRVQWSLSPSFHPVLGETVVDQLHTLDCTIEGLSPGTGYYIQVSAYNMKGWGPPRGSVPPSAVPSNWREWDGRPPRQRGHLQDLDQLFAQVKAGHQHCTCHEPSQPQPQSRKHSVSKSLKHLFHPGTKFLKTLKRGLHLASVFYKDSHILVTADDQIPVLEVDDNDSTLPLQDFLWLAKVSCVWGEVPWLRQCLPDSPNSCSCVLQTRSKMLLAVSQMQGLLGTQDLGRLFIEPIRDRQGNVLVVTLREVEGPLSGDPARWLPLTKLQGGRRSVSTPDEPSALDQLLLTLQEKLAFDRCSGQALAPGLYLGYLKLCSAVDQLRVLVPEGHPSMLCHVPVRDNPHVSREEWAWLQALAAPDQPGPPDPPEPDSCQDLLLQELRRAIRELVDIVNVPLQEAQDFRLYSQEVLDFGGQVSFLLLLPPSEGVCTAPGQIPPHAPSSGFLTLPLQMFELVHFLAYDWPFLGPYCRVSALLELEVLLSQQKLREAFSEAELASAKLRHRRLQDHVQRLEEIWREKRWLVDALQHARYKQPPSGIPLPALLPPPPMPTGPAARGEHPTTRASSPPDFLPSPTPSPRTPRRTLHGECWTQQGWGRVGGGGGGQCLRTRAGRGKGHSSLFQVMPSPPPGRSRGGPGVVSGRIFGSLRESTRVQGTGTLEINQSIKDDDSNSSSNGNNKYYYYSFIN